MNETKNQRDLLWEKAEAEQKEFVEELKKQTPDRIIESAYAKVMRDDIMIAFDSERLTEDEQKELANLEQPLASCYEEWLSNDFSYMDMLVETVKDFARGLVLQRRMQDRLTKNE